MAINLYATPPGADALDFERELAAQLRRLGVDPSLIPTVHASACDAPSPEFNILFAEGGVPPVSPTAGVVPGTWLAVIADAPSAASLPTWLSDPNAFRKDSVGTGWVAALVDEVLSSLWALRRERHVFLSYRRRDADGVADQVHDRLLRAGFHVFLDRLQLRPGEAVQREIDRAILDTDLVLCLVSPRLHESSWVKAELEAARAAGVGTLLAVWEDGDSNWSEPGRQYRDDLVRAQFVPEAVVGLPQVIRGATPAADSLPGSALERIVDAALRERTRSIAGRLKDLVGAAADKYSAHGPVLAGGLRGSDLLIGGRTVRVVPFRPGPRVLHTLHVEVGPATCFYAENDPHHPDTLALEWLSKTSAVTLETLGETLR